MSKIKANTVSTYIEGGIKVTVLRPSKQSRTITFKGSSRRNRSAVDYAFMHRVARK